MRARACASARVDMGRVRFVEVAYDDTWLRDSGPITLRDADGFRLLDFRFTGWGGKFEASRDDQLVETPRSMHGIFVKSARQPIDFALEGGAIETDGAGTLLTHLAMPARAPSRTSTAQTLDNATEAMAAAGPRALARPRLSRRRRHRRPHRHPRPLRRARTPSCSRTATTRRIRTIAELQAMAAELAALRTTRRRSRIACSRCRGRSPIIDEDRRLAASYANFLIVNGAVLMPAYGDPADARAQAVLAEAFPDREIVPVPCRPLIWQNGSLHCITMQLPQGLV